MAYVTGGRHFGQYTFEHWYDDEYGNNVNLCQFDSFCGLKCRECQFRAINDCRGCIASDGKPFYGTCEVADCAISKQKRFCGECENFPCEILKKYSFDETHGDNGARIENCKKIKTELDKRASETPGNK